MMVTGQAPSLGSQKSAQEPIAEADEDEEEEEKVKDEEGGEKKKKKSSKDEDDERRSIIDHRLKHQDMDYHHHQN